MENIWEAHLQEGAIRRVGRPGNTGALRPGTAGKNENGDMGERGV